MSAPLIPRPDGTYWNTIWLGRDGADAAEGWLPVLGVVRTSQLAVFERKVTIGDASKDSDDYISTWVQGDWTGGGQVLNLSEGVDISRYWWGTADTRSPHQSSLPPEVESSAPAGATGTPRPLGDVYSTVTDRPQTFYVAWDNVPYGYSFTTGNWHPAATGLLAPPVSKGSVAYKGRAASGQTRLFVPLGWWGYATFTEGSTAGSPTIAHSNTSTQPRAVYFCAADTRLFALDVEGFVWVTANGDEWSKLQEPHAQPDGTKDPITFDTSQTPRHLLVYLNRNGDPVLHLISDQAVWALQETAGTWIKTNVEHPPHPHFGRGAAVWRPGEDLWVSAGLGIVRLTSANVVAPSSGLDRDEGLPAEYRGHIADLQAEATHLYALVEGDAGAETDPGWVADTGFESDDAMALPPQRAYAALAARTETGWHALWTDDAGEGTPTWMGISRAGGDFALFWGMSDGACRRMKLHPGFLAPRALVSARSGRFAPTASLFTGRFDAGMLGFQKKASHVWAFMGEGGASQTEYVDFSYRTERLAWTPLGRASAVGANLMRFDVAASGVARGQLFNWMQFRLDYARGADPTKSPILDAFTLHFTKLPQNTQSFQITVPLSVEGWGRSAEATDDYLNALLTADEFLVLTHHDRHYRGQIAGISGNDNTGQDWTGVRTVNFLAVPDGTGQL